MFNKHTIIVCMLALCMGCGRGSSSYEPTTYVLGEVGDSPRTAFAGYSSVVVPPYTASVPTYPLPLNLNTTANYGAVALEMGMGPSEEELLKKNGFVLFESSSGDFVKSYSLLEERNVPIFVTTDTVLHLYHVAFDSLLRAVEEEEFFGDVVLMSSAMMHEMEEALKGETGDNREAVELAMAFFGVALKCADPGAMIPVHVRAVVDEEISNIEKHDDIYGSPLFHYKENYTQYKPRGHYTRSETLKKYFKAMMWYGRMVNLLREDIIGTENPEHTMRVQTLAACIISSVMNHVTTADGRTVKEIWDRIYAVTSFFVGAADDLTPYEYRSVIKEVCGSAFKLKVLSEKDRFEEIRDLLLQMRLPKVYSGTGCISLPPFWTPEDVHQLLVKTQGFRFMGQRLVFDSYCFQNLVNLHYTGTGEPFTMVPTLAGPIRAFPRGLDVMNVFGSARAAKILELEGDTEYVDELLVPDPDTYDEIVARLRDEYLVMEAEDLNRNLYFGWLDALKTLIEPNGAGFPTFMQTEAWTDKQLNTALASWTQLRHDTILYVKQTGGGMGGGPPPPPPPDAGYVEPKPEFYARLINLCNMTRLGLKQLDALPPAMETKLDFQVDMIQRLLEISVKELENQVLTPDDYHFIRYFSCWVQGAMMDDYDDIFSYLAADVHSDPNTMQCLEEATGYIGWVVAAFRLPNGVIQVGAGPALTYYEFKWPMADRLTDEAWEEMLKLGTQPERPGWTSSFSVVK